MGESYLKVTYWLGLVVRAKSVSIEERDGKTRVIVVPVDEKKETDTIVTIVSEVQSIELVKEE